MLPVSVVYRCWKHGDMVDAYAFYPQGQVLLIKKLCSMYKLIILRTDGTICHTYFHGTNMLEIREDVEGVAA